MQVLNVRIGYATNSSSTHSLIYIPNKADLARIQENSSCSPSFGWDEFVLKSSKEKQKYFMSLVCSSLSGSMPDRIIGLIVKDLVGYGGKEEISHDNWYVDHQSAYTIPLTKDMKDINKEFALDFYRYLMRENVVICGGNDNGGRDVSELLPNGVKYEDIGIGVLKDSMGDMLAKKQTKDIWTLFNTGSGAKITVSFSDTPDAKLKKSRTPDLIDMKITDWCDSGCPFCYQDSTVNGIHADRDAIESILYTLKDLEVFEVAFGGGDPVSHPHFSNILSTTRELGMIPNFSTKSTKWLKDPKMVDVVKKNVGAVGFSVRTMREVEDLYYLLEQANMHEQDYGKRNPVTLHYVMGSSSIDEFEKIVEVSHDYSYPLTLLGYKKTGRGISFEPHPYIGWMDIVSEYYDFSGIGIDTSLAKECQKELKKNKVNDKTYYTEEGKFSAYIDAVNLTMGPCSYCSPDKMVPIHKKGYELLDTIEEEFNGY